MTVTGEWSPCPHRDPRASPSPFLPCPVEKGEEESGWVRDWQPAEVTPPHSGINKITHPKLSPPF